MKRLQPQGSVLRLGGRGVHLRERPGQGPPVVLLGGCGLAMEFWRDVAQVLGPDSWLVAYDRPGLGGTEWPGSLPTLEEERLTLIDLLERLDRPAVVVAHSMASFHAEAVARTRPELVAGVVMVDGSVEWPAEPPRHVGPTMAELVGRAASIHSFGVLGNWLWQWGTWLQSNREFRALQSARLPEIYSDADSLAAATAEALAYDRQAWQLVELRRDHPWPPEVPVVVLTAAVGGWLQDRWVRTQMRWARLLGARHVVVEGSKHLMMLDRPEVVVEAIRAVINRRGLPG